MSFRFTGGCVCSFALLLLVAGSACAQTQTPVTTTNGSINAIPYFTGPYTLGSLSGITYDSASSTFSVLGDINMSGVMRYNGTPFFQVTQSASGLGSLAIGVSALTNINAGADNVAVGYASLYGNGLGSGNVAIGARSMQSNDAGTYNIGIGPFVMISNTEGNENVAIGGSALVNSTLYGDNVAIGFNALGDLASASGNTNSGLGGHNTAIGANVLTGLQTGTDNVALGDGAGDDVTNCTDTCSNRSAAQSIYIGTSTVSQTSGDMNEVVIGAYARGNGSNTVTLGNDSIASTVFKGNIVMKNGAVPSAIGASIQFPDASLQSTAWNGTMGGGDYAEAIDVRGDRAAYEPGDVITIDVSSPGKFAKSVDPYSRLVAGVYSTKPGLVGRRTTTDRPNKEAEVPMAMMGIVPIKVSAENGAIEPGDSLVSGSMPGYAMKGTDGSRMMGAVIGKALAPLASGSGVIEVLVSLR